MAVPGERVSGLGKVGADLMGAAGMQQHMHQGEFALAGQHFIIGDRLLATFVAGLHPSATPVAPQLGMEASPRLTWGAGNDSQILLFGYSLDNLPGQLLVGQGMDGKDDDPTGAAIKPLGHTDLQALSVVQPLVALQPDLQCLVEGSAIAGQSRLGLDTGWLVDDDKMRVFKEEVVLAEPERVERAAVEVDLDPVANSDRRPAFEAAPPGEMHPTQLDDLAQRPAREVPHLAMKEAVEPPLAIVVISYQSVEHACKKKGNKENASISEAEAGGNGSFLLRRTPRR